jgi:hypothetical protein
MRQKSQLKGPKPCKPQKPDSSSRNALPNSAPPPKRSSKKISKKRALHPDARRLQGETGNVQSVAEYTLERFNL